MLRGPEEHRLLGVDIGRILLLSGSKVWAGLWGTPSGGGEAEGRKGYFGQGIKVREGHGV